MGAREGDVDMYFVLNDRGEPILEPNLDAWFAWFERADRGVARTVVTPDVMVLTTFNGVDELGESDPPRLFESRVFGGPLNGEVAQSGTRAESLEGHARLVDWCRIGLSPDGGITEAQIS